MVSATVDPVLKRSSDRSIFPVHLASATVDPGLNRSSDRSILPVV